MKVVKKIDVIFDKAMHVILPFLTIAITAMIFIMVICRYVLHVNLGGAEELPTFIMIICVWIAGGAAARNDGHLKVDILFSAIKNEKIKDVMHFVAHTLEALVMWKYTQLAVEFVIKSYNKGQISAGLKFPMWWPQSFLLIGSVIMAIYFTANAIKSLLKLIGKGDK